MFEIQGKYNKAKVFATTVENECISQITEMCNQKWLKDCQIAIMPDTHAGKGATIGTTIKLKDKVSPSLDWCRYILRYVNSLKSQIV